jgi:hypothetical protein
MIAKVEVEVGNTSTVHFKLEVGATSETVEVTGAVQGVQSEDANISTDINETTIQTVPNPGGDLSYYAQLAPGVTMATATGEGYGNFSAFGLPATSNLFTIDGTDYNDPFLNLNNTGSSNLLLGDNDIADVSVVSNGYTGQYGRQAGAQVDYTTKAGTNAWHGNLIYDWNGSALNANDFFQNSVGNPRPFMNNNQWAAALGGPIKKNKLFFYVDTEGIRYVLGTSAEVYVPTPALEAYVISNLATIGDSAAIPFYQNIFALYNAAPGSSAATPVPTAATVDGDTCGGLGGPPMVSGSGSGATSTPQPFATTPCLASYYTSGSNGNTEWMLIGRVDYDISEKDKIFFRTKIDEGEQPTYTDPIDPSAFNIASNQPSYDGQVNYTHIFNPNVVNSFVGSILYYSVYFNGTNESASLTTFPDNLFSSDTALFPLGLGSNSYDEAVPDAQYPQGRNVTGWQLVDDISIQHGANDFKMGVNFRRDDVSDYTAQEGSFPAISTDLADFANDIADSAGMEFTKNGGQPLAYSSLGVYFQDEIRVSPKLKLTLAIRVEPGSTGTCQDSCASHAAEPFGDSPHDPVGDLLPMNQLVVSNLKQILPSVEKAVTEPRIGVAWTPFGQNTVIRGGIALFADLFPGDILDDFTRNSPTVNSFTVYGDAIAPADPNNAQAVLTACNTAYNNAFASGGTLDNYLDTNITLGSTSETASAAGCGTPLLYDAASPLLAPKYLEWNYEIQHSFGANATLSIDYVGNHGWDEYIVNPYLNSFYAPGMYYGTSSFGNLPAADPDTRVLDVLEITNQGISNYNGLTVSFQERLWHGLQGGINYSYSHSLDDLSNGLFESFSLEDSLSYQIDPYNLQKYNYASSDYDARHTMNAYYVWNIPFKSHYGWLNEIVGGWTLSETFFARTGFPFSIVDGNTGDDLFFDATNLDYNTVLAQPITKIPSSCTSINPNAPCYAESDFNPQPTTFATQARNQYRGPGYFDTDLTVHKTFRITESVGFTLGMNAFNVLNHVNFANPNANTAGVATFGYINSTVTSPTTPYGAFAAAATDMRIVQLTGKLEF